MSKAPFRSGSILAVSKAALICLVPQNFHLKTRSGVDHVRTFIVALAIYTSASSVWAAVVSENLLYQHCGKSALEAEQALCIGYISAISDVMESGDPVGGFRACVPSVANLEQLQGLLFRHLDTNLLYRHYNASTIVARFLAETFPCD